MNFAVERNPLWKLIQLTYEIIHYASFGTVVRADDQVCIILLYFCWVVRVHLHVESTKSLDKYLSKNEIHVLIKMTNLKLWRCFV